MSDAGPKAVLSVAQESEDTPQPTDSSFTDIYTDATLQPQDGIEGLRSWWKGAIPEGLYRMYKVQLLDREEVESAPQMLKLVFNLVGPNSEALQKGLFVYLYLEPHMVWPALPSTAQLAEKGQFAYLLLSSDFMELRAKVPTAPGSPTLDFYSEPGGKWPIGAGSLRSTEAPLTANTLRTAASFLEALERSHGQD